MSESDKKTPPSLPPEDPKLRLLQSSYRPSLEVYTDDELEETLGKVVGKYSYYRRVS